MEKYVYAHLSQMSATASPCYSDSYILGMCGFQNGTLVPFLAQS